MYISSQCCYFPSVCSFFLFSFAANGRYYWFLCDVTIAVSLIKIIKSFGIHFKYENKFLQRKLINYVDVM